MLVAAILIMGLAPPAEFFRRVFSVLDQCFD